ncbi:MAG: hypothetical protein OD918_00090, partial [Gammaproteobacteria bacterium]
TTEESPIKHKTKSLLKLAAAAMLFFAATPLHAADAHVHPGHSMQTLGFTEVGKGLPFIPRIDVMPAAAGGGAVEFSLDLHFGANTPVTLGIAPLIHYDSNIIEVTNITNIALAGLSMPKETPSKNTTRGYNQDEKPPTITIDGKLVTADTDTLMYLAWLDTNAIKRVGGATATRPVRIATITFRWKAGAIGNTHIGITQADFGGAHHFDANSILVRGPVAAEITAQRASIDVTAGETQFRVQCTSSRIFTTDAVCALALKSDAAAQALASAITPPIDGARIVIPDGATSGVLTFTIEPSASDSGRMLSIALAAADAGGAPLLLQETLVEIALMGPGLISKSSIVTVEGKTEKLSVQLATRPANGVVVVDVRSSDTDEAALAPASLTFTASDWDEAQTVSVTGADDRFVDGDTPYTIKFVVNAGKTGAIHYHGITTYVRGTTMDNDEAMPLLTAKPNKELTVGDHQIVITAELAGGGVYAFDRRLVLRKAGGSAVEGADYVPFALPQHIMIPAGMASAGVTFALTTMNATSKTISITAVLLGSATDISDITMVLGEFSWDVDSNGRVTAQDGIIAGRYLLGVRGEALVDGQSSANHADVAAYLESCRSVLNVSENGKKRADGTDGILITRYFLGLRGAVLVKGLSDFDIDQAATVETYIKQFLP